MILCDEAGLQSNADGIALLQKVEAKGARLRLIGDSCQHVSVSAGDFLRILETHSRLHCVEVNTIERQKAAAYKEAVIKLSVGDPIAGLEKLDAIGWVHEGKSAYLKDAAEAFFEKTNDGAEPGQCLAVCPTWRENFALTDAIRAGLRERGRLGAGRMIEVRDSLKWTLQQKRSAPIYQSGMVVTFHQNAFDFQRGQSARVLSSDGETVQVEHEGRAVRLPLSKASAFDVGAARLIEIAPGDRILIRSNNSTLGVVNGDLLNVRAVHEDGRIETAEGKTLPGTFREFAHGFVVTSHKSQGQTYNHVVVAAERFDAKAAYVAISRGKFSASLHTPDKEKLLMRDRKLHLRKLPSGDRTAVGDVLAKIEPSKAEAIIARMRQAAPLPERLAHWQAISRTWTKRLQRRAVKFPRWCGKKVARQFRLLLQIGSHTRKKSEAHIESPRVTHSQSL
jgi:ATP-dependent exoDNAse (exonuclease V) alpha subunit